MILDKSIWGNAGFIFTDYDSYFNSSYRTWSGQREFWGQKSSLPYAGGLPVFIKDFRLESCKDVRLYFTALGCCDIFINGRRIGCDELKPGWSSYEKRTLFYEYDISDFVDAGDNRILAVVSTGWYSGRIANGFYGDNEPAFMASVCVDGSPVVVTDESWRAFTGGQIRFADIWDGEVRDLRLDPYDALSMCSSELPETKNAYLFDRFDGEVTPFIGPTVRVREGLTLSPENIVVWDGVNYNGSDHGAINEVSSGKNLPISVKRGQTVTVDFGQESVGWTRIKVKAAPGTKITQRYAEFLNDSGLISRGNDGPKGSVYTINMRSAKAKSIFFAGDDEISEYASTFTFFGYRYVEIVAEGDMELVDIKAEVVGSDTKETGCIETSNELVNKLISNVIWGQRSNYLFVPTDCPQRDERLGWTGDTQAFSMTAAYNADVYGFFRKWLQDARDAQNDEGAVTDVVPRSGCTGSEDAAAWTDATVIVPYNMYRIYGNEEMIREHFDSMDKYVRHLINAYGYRGPEPRYGDWLAYEYCSNEYLSSAFLVRDLDILIELGTVLGREEVGFYKQERAKAYEYFKANFMKDGKLIGDTQTDYIVALAFDLLDESYAAEAAARLREKIIDNGYRLSCGFVGCYNLCPVLSKIGEDGLAYSLLMQRREPSWLYSVDQGATTIWERWNSYTLENGFGDVGMNSFNHYAYGSVMEWMYRFMAGIEPDEPGFRSIRLQPRIDLRTAEELPEGQEPMKRIRAAFKSASGMIESAWDTENGLVYECAVPAKTTLFLPLISEKIVINGKEHSADEFERDGKKAVIKLSAGKHVFEQI